MAELLRQSAAPERAGDVAILLEPHFAMQTAWRPTGGAEHGTPWPYDRHVPILISGDGVVPGRVDEPVAVVDLSRTLTDRLGVVNAQPAGSPLP